MSTDPADQYWNLYSYTGGNPTNLIDPDGMFVGEVLAGGQVITNTIVFTTATQITVNAAVAAAIASAAINIGTQIWLNASQTLPYAQVPQSVISSLSKDFVDPYHQGMQPGFEKWAVGKFTSGEIDATANTMTMARGSVGGKTFRHYGYSEDASKFAGGLNKGSYATTAQGRPMSGTTAQQKLALPHNEPPNAYYKIKVGPETPVNGPYGVEATKVPLRPGQGTEYIFPQGTPPGSVSGPYPIR